MSKLTKRQKEILQYIYDEVHEQGYPPTVREIGEAVNLSSTSTVHEHIKRLEKSGFIIKDSSKPRAIEITAAGLEVLGVSPDMDQIPMLGVVTAGEPITAVEEASDFFPLPNDLSNENRDLFMLTIRGDSMIEAGIYDRDQVIVRRQSSAANGEIVIAMTDEDEATCKRFYKEDGYFRLQPENESMDPIILDEVHILGKVIGLYRSDIF